MGQCRQLGMHVFRLAIIAAAALGCASCGSDEPGTKLAFGENKFVYYKDSVGEAEAQKLGEALVKLGCFTDAAEATVVLSRDLGHYTVAFVVREGKWDDDTVVMASRDLCKRLSQEAFDGQRVDIHLCDDKLNIRRMILGDLIKE